MTSPWCWWRATASRSGPGRTLKFPAGTSHNDLLLALLGLMGVQQPSFGNPAYCTGALSLA